jgi:DNA-binding response OmpR family regulator
MTKKQKILIVEDDPHSQILYKALLRDKYELFICESVLSAKEHLKKQKIDLVLLDLSLKGNEDGLVLARYIRENDRWNKVIIIAVTAHAFVFDRDKCLDAGCNDFFTKPIRGKTLISHIEKALVE